MPMGDPELAALVRRDGAADDVDLSLAALVNVGLQPVNPDEPSPVAANPGPAGLPMVGAPESITADGPAAEPIEAASADTSPTSELDVDAVPVLPVAAAVTDGERERPRRR